MVVLKRYIIGRFADLQRPVQREVINATLAGHDVYLQAATSFGKSLCFQLPAVVDYGSMCIDLLLSVRYFLIVLRVRLWKRNYHVNRPTSLFPNNSRGDTVVKTLLFFFYRQLSKFTATAGAFQCCKFCSSHASRVIAILLLSPRRHKIPCPRDTNVMLSSHDRYLSTSCPHGKSHPEHYVPAPF